VDPRLTESLDIEMRLLEREQAGVVHKFRLDHLARRLDRGPIAIQDTLCGFSADRITMELDDGHLLAVRLLARCRVTIAALCSIHWDDRVGWLIVVRASSGDRLLLKAWRAELHLPAAN
jgi:hypothetical protein